MGIRFEIYPNPDPTLLNQDLKKPAFTQQIGPDASEVAYDFLIAAADTEGEGILEDAEPINYGGDRRNAVKAHAFLEDEGIVVIYESNDRGDALKELHEDRFDKLDVYAVTDDGLYKASFISDPSQTYQGNFTDFI